MLPWSATLMAAATKGQVRQSPGASQPISGGGAPPLPQRQLGPNETAAQTQVRDARRTQCQMHRLRRTVPVPAGTGMLVRKAAVPPDARERGGLLLSRLFRCA